MSKGFLYDTGDELITRQDVSGVPVPEASDLGGIAVVGEDGWEIKPSDFVVNVAYKRSENKLKFGGGVKVSDIKAAVEAGKDVYFCLRIQDTSSFTEGLGAGIMMKVSYGATRSLIGFFGVPAYVVKGDSDVKIEFISFAGTLASLTDSNDYIAPSVISITTTIDA